MVQKLYDLKEGTFFRKYMGHREPVELCIYRISEYDKLRDVYICNRYFTCGIVDCVILPGAIDVYPI